MGLTLNRKADRFCGCYPSFHLRLEAEYIESRMIFAAESGIKSFPLIQTLSFQVDQIRQVSGDDALLAQHYCQASALVYPSTYEGFGLPPLEAMSLGCPVISSHASVMPEICGNAAEYFEPLDIESIRQAIEAVLSSAKRREELIAKGLAQAAHYSWPICAERHLSIYQRLVDPAVITQ